MWNKQEITNTAKITAIRQQRKVTLSVRRTKLGLHTRTHSILTVHTVSIHHAVAAIITPALRPPSTWVNTSQHLTQLADWLTTAVRHAVTVYRDLLVKVQSSHTASQSCACDRHPYCFSGVRFLDHPVRVVNSLFLISFNYYTPCPEKRCHYFCL